MKINDVKKLTGLTAKALRLYESKGLISVSREENGYRSYTQNDVEILKEIKLYRSIGISLSDIKLYLFGIISKDELIEKRKAEILRESGKNSEKYKICRELLSKGTLNVWENANSFTENEKITKGEYGSLAIGIDLGTTTISATIYDIQSKKQIEIYAIPHNSYIKTGTFSEQDAGVITEKAKKLLFHILDTYKNIVSIGITGQMHGIVYVNSQGKAVSNLFNWQDKRGDIPLDNGKTTCQLIYDKTGEIIHTGFGIATHYYNMHKNSVPSDASCICTIMDLFAMEICENKAPLLHASVGASLGLFDVKNCRFKLDKLGELGISKELLPKVTRDSVIIGACRDIPVAIPIGDNQASFLGSVRKNKNCILVNIGTGSQVSFVSSEYKEPKGDLELRPFIEGGYLVCGSALCGGFAYSMLEEFFRSYIISAGIQEKSQYEIMNKIAREALENNEEGRLVDACFCGKRSDPDKRGSINMIDRYSFTPSALIIGVLKGMCNELYELCRDSINKKTHIVASGGAVRRTDALKDIIAKCFGASVSTSKTREEAATGVALFSALTTKTIKYNDGFNEYV